MDGQLAGQVVQVCFTKFRQLSKQGKPTDSQWTVLSGFLLTGPAGQVELVSLATGTKCQDGATRRACTLPGSLLHDSHAEVLARRGLQLWLLHQAGQARLGQSDYLQSDEEGQCQLKSDWRVTMLSTCLPCGDATIFEKEEEVQDEEDVQPAAKRRRVVVDQNRTGAKPVVAGVDPLGVGTGYHRVGAVRTKPGRGDRTLSLSCSDKILKWNLLGLQGALPGLLLPAPLPLHSFILAGITLTVWRLPWEFHPPLANPFPIISFRKKLLIPG